MIKGLKIELTTDELRQRLAERILCHLQAAEECEEAQRRGDGSDERVARYAIEHEFREHREQAGLLTLIRDHLVPGEVYRLGERDLRFVDLVPDIYVPYTPTSPAQAVDEDAAVSLPND
jgi:hypothetical protein